MRERLLARGDAGDIHIRADKYLMIRPLLMGFKGEYEG